MHCLAQILENGVRSILLHTRRDRSRGWAFWETVSSNIWGMPISQTVVMRSGSDYRSLSLVHGRKSVISKFDPLKNILGGRWGSGIGVIRYVPEGIYSLQRRIFPVDPKDLRHISKLRKKWPATVIIFGVTCTHTLKRHPLNSKLSTLGYVNSKGVVQRQFLSPFVRGVKGYKISRKNYEKKFWSLGGSCPFTPSISELWPAYGR